MKHLIEQWQRRIAAATGWSVAPAPKRAWMQEWDCQICGHETLKKPVFISGPDGNVVAAGTRCAAIMVYGREDASAQTRVRNEFDALAYKAKQEEELRAERLSRYTKALQQFRSDQDGAPELISVRQTYWSTVRGVWGGEHRMKFPEFIQWVIDHQGELPDR